MTDTEDMQPTVWRHGNWSCNGSNCQGGGKSRWEEAQIRTEIIAGSVIGGFMFLIGVGLLVWLCMAWRRLKRVREKQERESKSVRMQEMGRESVVTSLGSGSVETEMEMWRRSQRTVSRDVGRESVVMDRDRVGSPLSETGGLWRGMSTLDIYDDEDVRPRIRMVPTEVEPEPEAETAIEMEQTECAEEQAEETEALTTEKPGPLAL